jgi:thiol-disulfide isomerase/thioredoxin
VTTSATPLVPTTTPDTTPSGSIPSPSPTAAGIHLPPTFDPTREAWRDIDEALKQAAVDHKQVLLDFGASWCPSCRELDQSFKDPRVQALLRSVHRVRVDTGPRTASTNTDIAEAYGLDLTMTGLPGLVLLAPQGNVVANTNDGLFDNDLPNSPSVIIGFLKPHL